MNPHQPRIRPRTRPRIDSTGFTLIELCLVLALLGVFIAMTLPSLRNLRKNYLIEMTAQDMTDCMTFARASAIAERSWYKLDFKRAPVLYTLYKMDVSGDEPSAPIPASGRWGAGKTVAPEIDLQTTASTIYFYPNGTSTAAKLTLSEQNIPPLSVELSGTLGYATISR